MNNRTLDLKIELKNLSGIKSAKLFFTSADKNMSGSDKINLSGGTLTATIPPASVFTIESR